MLYIVQLFRHLSKAVLNHLTASAFEQSVIFHCLAITTSLIQQVPELLCQIGKASQGVFCSSCWCLTRVTGIDEHSQGGTF